MKAKLARRPRRCEIGTGSYSRVDWLVIIVARGIGGGSGGSIRSPLASDESLFSAFMSSFIDPSLEVSSAGDFFNISHGSFSDIAYHDLQVQTGFKMAF